MGSAGGRADRVTRIAARAMSTATSAPNPKFANFGIGTLAALPYPAAVRCRYNATREPLISHCGIPRPRGSGPFDVGIDRHHRAPSADGLRRVPGAARRRLDRAADAALSQSAARSHRGADLWPRMAARLRQAAAVAVVAGGTGLPRDRRRGRLLRAGADRGGV